MKTFEDMTEPELQCVLNTVAGQIESTCELMGVEKPYFALLMFNDPKIAQYVCNCECAGVIKAMRECADRLEGRDTVERSPF